MSDEKLFEAMLAKALRIYGYDIPLTEEELLLSEEALKNEEYPKLLDDLDDPNKILNSKWDEKLLPLKHEIAEETLQNLARAARDGKNIPDEIKKRMEQDRKKSEDEKQD